MIHRLIIIVTILAVSGCSYKRSGDEPSGGYQWRSLWREDVRTVAVPLFSSADYTRGVEIILTKAVINQLQAYSPYKVVPRERADTILEGTVTSVRRDTISRGVSAGGVPQEQLYSITVDFTWKDLRTGKILVERRNFEQTTTYYPTLGEGQFVANQQAAERLALAIVQELQAPW